MTFEFCIIMKIPEIKGLKMKAQTIYSDAVGKIAVINGNVRIELLTIDEVKENKEMSLKSTNELIMPLDGFVKSFETQKKIIDALIQDGILKLNDNK